MKFEIFSTTGYLGLLDSELIFNQQTDIVAVGSMLVLNEKSYVVKDVVIRKDGNVKLLV